MKKRLKGLLALVMALSMLVGTTLSGEALAAEYIFNGSSLSDSSSGENATELLAGDELVSSFTGGFAVYNDATGKSTEKEAVSVVINSTDNNFTYSKFEIAIALAVKFLFYLGRRLTGTCTVNVD